jgi:hypothetical protein
MDCKVPRAKARRTGVWQPSHLGAGVGREIEPHIIVAGQASCKQKSFFALLIVGAGTMGSISGCRGRNAKAGSSRNKETCFGCF